MKKISLLAIAFILFTGCSFVPKSITNMVKTDDNRDVYKTECGTDGCGKSYKDTTYRDYNNLDGCNNCKSNSNKCQDCNKQRNQLNLENQVIAPTLPNGTSELKENSVLRVNVTGQGVAPVNTSSPAQAYALAKRAAIADAYRLLAEKIKGVHVEGQDFIENMMVKRSSVRTSVAAMIRNANAVETTFKEGLCEVEMEVTISHSQFAL